MSQLSLTASAFRTHTRTIAVFFRTHTRTDGRDLLAYGVLAFALAMLPAAVAFAAFLLTVGAVCAIAAAVAGASGIVRDRAGRWLWQGRILLADNLHAIGDAIDPRPALEPPPPAAVPVPASTFAQVATEHVKTHPLPVPPECASAAPAHAEPASEPTPLPMPAAHRHLWCGAGCHTEPFKCRCPRGNDEPAPRPMPAAARVIEGPVVGPVAKAALCAGCGATVPSSWTAPEVAVTVGNDVYCSERCRPAPGSNTADAIRAALAKAGSIRGAADLLGTKESTLRGRMKRLGLVSPKAKGRGRADKASASA
jgi:hypothetical protein